MKSRILTLIAAITFSPALAMPIRLATKDQRHQQTVQYAVKATVAFLLTSPY
jgi:hypothetical protein